MKNFGLIMVLVTLSASLVLASPTTSTKEHKKKLMEKLRAALNVSEAEVAAAAVASVSIPSTEELAEIEKVVTPEEEGVAPAQDEVGAVPAVVVVEGDKTTTEVVATNTGFMARFRSALKRIMELFGFRRRKDGRKSRLLSFDDDTSNDLLDRTMDRTPVYQEEVRTTVGAVLGQKECIQKVACVSGSYLNGVKGKQLIFALLDVFSPTTWKETVKIAKQSAIFNESCDYKCLE